MDTIYSKIIWDELGYTPSNYKLHEEKAEKTEQLILNWIKNTPLEKVNEVLFNDLSWLKSITYEDYYDGIFYGINQKEPEERKKDEHGRITPDILVHDIGILPTLLMISIKTKIQPNELIFMAKLLEAYYDKLPKDNSCDLNSTLRKKTGEEL